VADVFRLKWKHADLCVTLYDIYASSNRVALRPCGGSRQVKQEIFHFGSDSAWTPISSYRGYVSLLSYSDGRITSDYKTYGVNERYEAIIKKFN